MNDMQYYCSSGMCIISEILALKYAVYSGEKTAYS